MHLIKTRLLLRTHDTMYGTNKVMDRVEVIDGDAREARRLIPAKANRIIMNLPFQAHAFFSIALSIAADCCTIHYYDILREEDVEPRWKELQGIAADQGFSLDHGPVHRLKSYSAQEFYIGLDITAIKKN